MSEFAPDDPRHGTRNLYNQGCRCDFCRENNRIAHRQWQDSHGGVIPDGIPHGRVSTYQNWRCRCAPCTAVHSAEVRRRQADRLRRGLAPDDPRHGTIAAYQGWGCRCDPCRDAASEYHRNRRRAS